MPLVLSGTNGISTNGTNWGVQLDSGGRVRHPYVPYARVSRNSGTWQGVSTCVFNYADEDPYSIYNTTTGRFTAPVAGKYLLTHGLFTQNGYEAWPKWRINGTIINTTYTSVTSGYSSVAGASVLNMAANDWADLYLDSASYRIYGSDRTQCWAAFVLIG